MVLRRWSMTTLPPAGRMRRGFAACAQLGCPASHWPPAELSQVCHKGPVSAAADTERRPRSRRPCSTALATARAVRAVAMPIYLRGHYGYRASRVVVTCPVAMAETGAG